MIWLTDAQFEELESPTKATRLEGKKERNQLKARELKETKKRLQLQRRQDAESGIYKPRVTVKPQLEIGIRNGSGHAQRAGG